MKNNKTINLEQARQPGNLHIKGQQTKPKLRLNTGSKTCYATVDCLSGNREWSAFFRIRQSGWGLEWFWAKVSKVSRRKNSRLIESRWTQISLAISLATVLWSHESSTAVLYSRHLPLYIRDVIFSLFRTSSALAQEPHPIFYRAINGFIIWSSYHRWALFSFHFKILLGNPPGPCPCSLQTIVRLLLEPSSAFLIFRAFD